MFLACQTNISIKKNSLNTTRSSRENKRYRDKAWIWEEKIAHIKQSSNTVNEHTNRSLTIENYTTNKVKEEEPEKPFEKKMTNCFIMFRWWVQKKKNKRR